MGSDSMKVFMRAGVLLGDYDDLSKLLIVQYVSSRGLSIQRVYRKTLVFCTFSYLDHCCQMLLRINPTNWSAVAQLVQR